jgi:hypothetical protein
VAVLNREHDHRAWAVWHVAAMSHMDPKKMPRLSQLQSKKKPDTRRQSQEEITHNLKLMFIAFGGNPSDLEKFKWQPDR